MPSLPGKSRDAETVELNTDALYATTQQEWDYNDRELRRLRERQATLERILAELRRYAAAAHASPPASDGNGRAPNGGPSFDIDVAMRNLTTAYPKLSPRLGAVLRGLVIIELEQGQNGASAREVTAVSGVEDGSGTASTHTYLERLKKLGLVERLAGKPARFRLTGKAREVARRPK
jgi:hypothetical protein